MRSKRLFAAMLCAVMLLAGCSEAPGSSGSSSSTQSSSASISSDSEYYSSSTESSSSEPESSSYSSSSTTSSRQMSSTSSPKTNEIIKDTLKPWICQIFDGESSNGTHIVEYYYKDTKYNYTKIRVYVSPNQNNIGRIAGEFDHEAAPFMAVQVALSPGTNYYRIQLIGENVESQISSPYEYTKAGGSSGSSSVPRYTHTFTAPSYLTVIPDYSEALAEIERGEEPDSFSISVQFTCPGCGNKRTYNVWLVQFPYSRDGEMPFHAKCGMTNCIYGKKEFSTTIQSHAVRIS